MSSAWAGLVVLAGLTLGSAPAVQGDAEPVEPAGQAPPFERYTQSIPNSLVTFEMVAVPGGTVALGEGDAAKTVTVDDLWMGQTEVTWDLYDIYAYRLDLTPEQQEAGVDAAIRPSKPYGVPDRGYGHAGYPAGSMTYHAARQFCRWLSRTTGHSYRLPTEAEWVHACRAGGEAAELADVGWYWDNAQDKTHPVGSKTANAWGLHDMLGNVGEWVLADDGRPALFGGSFMDDAEELTCTSRNYPTDAWQMSDPQVPKSRWWLSDAPFAGVRVVRERDAPPAGDTNDNG